MKTIKISEATPDQLNWLVAKIEGTSVRVVPHICNGVRMGYTLIGFLYTTDWAHGGPIIERERITVSALYAQKNPPSPEYDHGEWGAYIPCGVNSEGSGQGPTPLIAAMRCYVMSKLGEEAQVPEEL